MRATLKRSSMKMLKCDVRVNYAGGHDRDMFATRPLNPRSPLQEHENDPNQTLVDPVQALPEYLANPGTSPEKPLSTAD